MPSLLRAGVVLAVLGLGLATLWAVALGATAASTEVDCGEFEPTYSLDGVDPATATVRIDDGCNVHIVSRPVVAGAALAAVGCVLGGAGLARETVGE